MKRVLVVSFDFPPQGGTGTIRVAKFAKYLPQFGWQPVVVCSDVMFNRDDSLARDVPADVAVYRVPGPRLARLLGSRAPSPAASTSSAAAPAPHGPSLRQVAAQMSRHLLVPDVHVLWTGAARRICAEVLREQPCDAVLTTSPPNSVHLVGRWVHSRFGLPWVADFRDVWTAENQALQKLGAWHFARQRRAERRILANCDRGIMITDPLRQRVLGVFGAGLAQKLVTITNGFDPDDVTGTSPRLDDGRFTIAYIGTILGPQVGNAFPDGLRLAVQQSETFRLKTRVRFVGRLDPIYRARLAGLEDNVEVVDFVPHRTAVEAMRSAHLLLIVLPDTALASMTYTNKFFEYLAARRPMLALVPPGLIADIVTQERLGAVAPPDDVPAIAQALLALFEAVQAQAGGYRASEALLTRFDRRELTGKLAAVLDDVVRC